MSDKKYYLGIDGGGSKTAFAIIDENNNLVYYKECGPSSLDTVSLNKIKEVFIEGTSSFKYQVDGVFAGLGGISSISQQEKINELIASLKIVKPSTKIDSGNDCINALYGSLNGEDGIVLIAGTGSVCYGKHNDKYFRAGGYCYQEGDGGSSYYLGYRALQYLARVIDKRMKKSDLSEALKKEINCYDYSSLASYFVSANRTQIASLSKIVTKYSYCSYAKKIIKDGVDEVLLMIKTVYRELKFDQEIKFSIIGSLGNADTLYKELLLKGIKKIDERIIFVNKMNEAYFGSALKAKEVAKC